MSIRRQFQKTAQQAQPWAGVQQAPPQAPRIADVGPGTTVYRTMDQRADVDPQWDFAVRVAMPLGVVAVMAGGWSYVPKLWPLWAGISTVSLVADGLFVWINRDLLLGDDKRFVAQERDNEQAQTENAPQPQRHLLTLRVQDGPTTHYINDLEITLALQEFCRRVLLGSVSFSEGGAKASDLDKPAFIDLRDKMLERGFIAWKNKKNTRSGYHYTRNANLTMREIRDYTLPSNG